MIYNREKGQVPFFLESKSQTYSSKKDKNDIRAQDNSKELQEIEDRVDIDLGNRSTALGIGRKIQRRSKIQHTRCSIERLINGRYEKKEVINIYRITLNKI